MAHVVSIFLKRAKRGPMDAVSSATLVAGRGLRGNANQGGRRQVTLLSRERWEEIVTSLGTRLDPRARRANVVLSGIDLERSRGRVLRIGTCRLRVNGETRPCERMEEALEGLQDAMRTRWGGGAFAEVLDGGEIRVDDTCDWEPGLIDNHDSK